jgi:hypothetical protein
MIDSKNNVKYDERNIKRFNLQEHHKKLIKILKNAVFWDIKLSSYLIWSTLCDRYRAQTANAM